MARLVVPDGVRANTEAYLRACGGGRRECIVVWTARLEEPGRVVRAVHPHHAASAVSTQLVADGISTLFEELVLHRERVVAQVHTHPGAAFHSSTDDSFPLIHTKGFLSVVVPVFGRDGLRGLPGCYVAEHLGGCRWREVDGQERDDLVHWEEVPR